MTEFRYNFRVDVTALPPGALPPGRGEEPVEVAATLIADPETVGEHPAVVIGIPGRHLSPPLLGPAAAGPRRLHPSRVAGRARDRVHRLRLPGRRAQQPARRW